MDPQRLVGATVRATNRTFGLAPARPTGPEETVAEVIDTYDLTIRTVEGNVYLNGGFTVIRFAADTPVPL